MLIKVGEESTKDTFRTIWHKIRPVDLKIGRNTGKVMQLKDFRL